MKGFCTWAADNRRSWPRDGHLVKPLVRFFQGRRLGEISPWLVEKYKHERLKATVRGRRIAGATVNRELSCLRRLFNLAIQWGKASTNPAARFKLLPELNHVERVLTPVEAQGLLAACCDHLRPMVLLALHTGMRRGEILGLTWEQADVARRMITLTQTKSGRVRRLPMADLVVDTLKQRPRSGPFVFGGEQPHRRISTAWRGACRRADLGRVRFHDLRHTWASWLVEEGVDLRTVQELGGWSSLKLLERYAHPTTAAKVRAAARVGARLAARPPYNSRTVAAAPAPAVAVSMLS